MIIGKTSEVLRSLQHREGLFIAAPSDKTGYSKAWLRDNIYVSLGVEFIDKTSLIRAMNRLFDIFLRHEYKIDWAIKEKPKHSYQYIHARYNPETLDEYWEDWGNKQNDAIGAFLFRVGDLMNKGYKVIRNEHDIRILKKLVAYLESIEYWHDKDNGMWEENEEVHASSVGACVAGLKMISKYIPVSYSLIKKGYESLSALLPKESETKDVDIALLSLIYPYNIATQKQKESILKNVEKNLVRQKGLIRYKGDKYYNRKGEAEWTMGLVWLAIIYKLEKNQGKYIHYMKKTLECFNSKGELPELYYANSPEHNDNSPLSWAQSLYIVAAL